MRERTYQVDACAEAALGFMVSYLGTSSIQVPYADTTTLRDTCKILTISGQGNGPRMNIFHGDCRVLISKWWYPSWVWKCVMYL